MSTSESAKRKAEAPVEEARPAAMAKAAPAAPPVNCTVVDLAGFLADPSSAEARSSCAELAASLKATGIVLLRDSRVLVLDEATANLDQQTDELIQRTTLRGEAMRRATVLTIAHRLNTIATCDRVLVMDAGVVAELAPPDELRQREGSIFGRLWQAAQHD